LTLKNFWAYVKRLPDGALDGRHAPKPNLINQMVGFVRIEHFEGEPLKMVPHSLEEHYRAR
jgi:hypothetical protein